MKDAILNFAKQFAWEPEIENEENLQRKDLVIAAGMGGSHLAADILRMRDPFLDIVVNSDYDLAGISGNVLQNSMVVVVSYSGNTEEAISAFETAIKKEISVVAISIGGKLLELAKSCNAPFVQIPDTGIQPRMAIGFLLMALLKVVGRDDLLKEARELQGVLDTKSLEKQAQEIVVKLQDKIPVMYASLRNCGLSYIWKIKLNEGVKIPAFCSAIPEANHNEINGFSAEGKTQDLALSFAPVFLVDEADDPRIKKRMAITKKMYEGRGISCMDISLRGYSIFEKVFSSVLLCDWIVLRLSEYYGTDPEQVPMVEEFKKLM